MRAAIYARVSTDDQAREGYSIPDQLKRLNAYCKAKGWKVAGEFVDDGYSGRNIDRPAYQRMLEQREDWDVLLVLKMDRIHRNSQNFAAMMDHLNAWKKQFNSMQEKFDTTTAMGRFVMDTIQRIAQLESEQIGERTYSGMAQKAETGGMLGFYPPFGYLVKDNDMVIVEEEAMVVRELFSRYCEGETMAALAESLNERGLRTRRGQQWTLYSIRHILHNPAYAGYRRWDGILVKSQHPSIIDVQTFNAAQVVAAERTKDPRFKSAKMLPA